MKARLPILLLLCFQMLTGCSNIPTRKVELADLDPEQLDRLNREALVLASERLEKMIENAKGNPQSSHYLASDLFLKANMSLIEGDYTTASVLFKYVTDLAPEDSYVQKKYAISLIRMGALEESKVVLSKLYQSHKEEKVGMILAGVYTGLDEEDKARSLYQSLLAKNPANEDACIFLSKAYAMEKEMTRAINQLNKCSKANPKSGIYDYYLGKLSIDQGKINKALEFFARANRKQPDLNQAVNALGIIYEDQEKFASAIKVYENYLKIDPTDSSILNRMVQVLFTREKYQEVIPYAEKLSDLEPENLNLKVKLGVLYTDAKKFPEAISIFKDLLAVAPQSDKILYYLGAIFQEIKEFQNSIEYFNQIPSSSGLYSDSAIQMANMLSTLAQTEISDGEGDKWQKQFLSLVNKRMEENQDLKIEFSVIKAGFFEGIGQYKKAMEAMSVAQDDKNFSTNHKYYLASLYEKEKKYEESTKLIMSIIDKDPKNAQAWNFLGYSMLLRENSMDKAYEFIQTALKINPNDGYIRDTLGWYLYKKGEVKKALSHLLYAHSQVPDDVDILKHLAIIHTEMNENKKAKSYLERALKHVRTQNDKKEIMASIEKLETDRLPASDETDE
jgi:tetratricopeptide (TPR) repeat protein